jgi:hypothetical protein
LTLYTRLFFSLISCRPPVVSFVQLQFIQLLCSFRRIFACTQLSTSCPPFRMTTADIFEILSTSLGVLQSVNIFWFTSSSPVPF